MRACTCPTIFDPPKWYLYFHYPFYGVFYPCTRPFVMPYQNEPSESAPERTDKSRGAVFSLPTKERTFRTASRRRSSSAWSSRTYFSVRNTEKEVRIFRQSCFGRSEVVRGSTLSKFPLFLFDFGRRRYGIRSAHLCFPFSLHSPPPETRWFRFSYGNKICRFWISIFADAKRKTCRASTIVAQKANDPSSLFGTSSGAPCYRWLFLVNLMD